MQGTRITLTYEPQVLYILPTTPSLPKWKSYSDKLQEEALIKREGSFGGRKANMGYLQNFRKMWKISKFLKLFLVVDQNSSNLGDLGHGFLLTKKTLK